VPPLCSAPATTPPVQMHGSGCLWDNPVTPSPHLIGGADDVPRGKIGRSLIHIPCRTPGLSRAWKPKQRRSVRCKASAPGLG
jgi:hypothetical protein